MFYKLIDGELISGEHVDGPEYSLSQHGEDEYSYPVDGWYYFPDEETARAFFAI